MINVPVTTKRFALIIIIDKFIRVIFSTFRKWYKRPRIWLLIMTSIMVASVVTAIIVVPIGLIRKSTMSSMETSASSSVGRWN
jgi:hypothetical protein